MEATQLVTALGPDAPDDGDAGRQQRGLAIAALVPINKHRLGYKIQSQSGQGHYIVNIDDDPICTCPDYELRQRACKHIVAAQLTAHLEKGRGEDSAETNTQDIEEEAEEANEPMDTLPTKPTYGQNWPAYRIAQEYEQEHFEVWLRGLCDLVEQPDYMYGRPRLPVADMVYCIGLKVYSGMSRRRVMTAVRRARERGLLSHEPSSATITRYMDDANLTSVLKRLVRESSKPLASVETEFAIDSTGFSATTYDRWFDHKWGRSIRQAQWVKAHIVCGVRTNIISAVEASSGNANDSPFLPDLLRETLETFPAERLTGDKAYLSVGNIDGSEELGVEFLSPFKENSVARTPNHGPRPNWEKAFYYYHLHRDEFLKHYHLRSNVEATMQMIKSKFGASVKSKTETARFNEILVKALCHNICVLVQSMYESGVNVDFGSGPAGMAVAA